MDILSDILSLTLSLFALAVAIITSNDQKKMQIQENITKCRIKASSISDGITIRIENVGNSIIHITDITCNGEGLYQNERDPQDAISRFFYGIPCKTRKEARLSGDYLFPNSKHNLFSITFSTQESLMVAWEVIAKLEIIVHYEDIYGNKEGEPKRLDVDYESFWDAILIGTEQDKEEKEQLLNQVKKKPGYRTLASFEQTEDSAFLSKEQ